MATKAETSKPVADVGGQLPDEMLPTPFHPWPEAGFRPLRRPQVGAILGGLAGCVSLLLNVIGSVAWPAIGGEVHHPLRLIQVFLTFPLGESALDLNSGALLALGCILYLATEMLYGMLLEFTISYLLPHAGAFARLLFFTVSALALWAVIFYGLISWLQPLLFHGRWILEWIPWWVAALTHLAFGVMMALIYPLGNPRPQLATVDRSVDV